MPMLTRRFLLLASLSLWATLALAAVDPSISADQSGMVHLVAPNGICFEMGSAKNQSAQPAQSLRGPKGDTGAAGRDGKDGRDGRDGLAGAPGSNASCSVSNSGSASQPMAYELFSAPGPNWLNLNRSKAPAISVGEVVGVVTYGLEKYHHGQMSNQFVCRYENEAGDKIYSPYAPLDYYHPSAADYNIGCKLPNVTAWPYSKRKATVTVWFQNRTQLMYTGKPWDNQIEFVENWINYTYNIVAQEIVIDANGVNPKYTYTVKLTWPNGTSISVSANPKGFKSVVFNLTSYSNIFVGKQLVTLTISLTNSGILPFAGNTGDDSVVLQQLQIAKHSGCSNYNLLNQAWRKASNTDQSTIMCDQRSGTGIKTLAWNRIDPSIGGKMLEKCPSKNRCGTHAPGWLDMKHPTALGVEVSGRACFHWSSNCCNWQANIKVVNCGSFYVYYMNAPPVCSLAYCGDDS